MRAFSIFDDFPKSAIDILTKRGIIVDSLPKGKERPSGIELEKLLNEYDILFISTAQKLTEDMFFNITKPKIIGTASSGVDHIHIPSNKRELIRVANATNANRSTVTEHTFGLILTLRKRLIEGRKIAVMGKTKKEMSSKPKDLLNSTIGVIGAGGIATSILEMAGHFGMKRLCWTFHPKAHIKLKDNGVQFVSIENLLMESDVISVNIPFSEQTYNIINAERVSLIKEDAIFISTSRIEVTDRYALFEKAHNCSDFSLGLDVDAAEVKGLWSEDMNNVIVTPHIGGGTVESRVRLFNECAANVISLMNKL